jgi:hypothetical protein
MAILRADNRLRFMQSEGLTNDHAPDCFVNEACESERNAVIAGRALRP